MDIETFLNAYGLAAVFGIMLAKAIGVPIPIPADALMLATSARVATGKMALPAAFAALLIALLAGGLVQFTLVRGAGRGLLTRYGRFFGITPARLDNAAKRMQTGGVLGIGIAVLTPGIRSVAVVACGLAGIPVRLFAPGLLLGSALFLALHFFLGYIGGSLLASISASIPLPLMMLILVVLLAAGFAAWYAIRRRQRPEASVSDILADAAGSWHEATCPVCLALGAANRLQITLPIDHDHHHSGEHAHGS
jgi:membrane protein DedA with SNARE-associated domain